jgi:hypothetical protein
MLFNFLGDGCPVLAERIGNNSERQLFLQPKGNIHSVFIG